MELLCPAGNIQNLKSALVNGADAIYLGFKKFSARNNAENFENLYSVIEFLHKNNVKAYVTLNTLVNDKNIKSWLESAYEVSNADAFIVQDLGCAMLLKEHLPNIPIHASTQMSVHNLQQCVTLKELGFSRIVLARELSYNQIQHITKNCDIQTEVFVHGALCYCYSGQCLMSSFIGARSANQGMCAQPCRLNYEISNKNGYLLNTKDLCLVDEISKLKELNVTSLKIEGRMKNPFYTGVTAKVYKKAINSENLSKEDRKMLSLAFNRGFTKGNFLTDKAIFAKELTKTNEVKETSYLKKFTDEIETLPTPKIAFEFHKVTIDKRKKIPEFYAQVTNEKQAIAVEKYAKAIYVPIDSKIKSTTKCIGVYPVIINDDEYQYYKGFEKEYDEVLLPSFIDTQKIKHGDVNLNVMNCHTLLELKNLGFVSATLSGELTARQIKDMQINDIKTQVIVYGRQTLMTSSYCPINCDKKSCLITPKTCLKDRTQAKFPLIRNKNYCEISILNSVPLFIGDKLCDIIADIYRLVFTTENPKDCEKIMQIYTGILPASEFANKFTRGHFYRGVT